MNAAVILLFVAILIWLAATGKFTAILDVVKNQAGNSSP